MTDLRVFLARGAAKRHLKCEARGCTRNRTGVSHFCHGHLLRRSRYGHVEGKAILPKQYQRELEEVNRFLDDHPTHPATIAAETFFARWMEAAARKEAPAGQAIFARLNFHQVTPRELLAEVCAVWLFSERHPRTLPDDQRLTYALSRNAARLAGFQRKTYGKHVSQCHPSTVELRESGERIRHTLARTFVNLTHAIKAKDEADKATSASLATPFI